MSEADDGFLSRWARRKARVQGGQGGQGTPEHPADGPTAPQASGPAGAVVPGGPSAGLAAERPDMGPSPPATATRSPETQGAARPSAAPGAARDRVALPTMDDVALLTRTSDYARFVAPGVDSGVKNAALKRLFMDPHFNIMDGLDTYIDDYGKPDPIPLSMLRQMNQSKFLGLFDHEEETKAGTIADTSTGRADALAAPDGAPPPALAESTLPESPPLHEPDPADGVHEQATNDHADLRLQQDDAPGRPGAASGARA